jgi:hypothetical protein
MLETHTRNQFRKLMGREKYSLEVLSKIRDFRTLVNIRFVTYLSKKSAYPPLGSGSLLSPGAQCR